MMIHASLPSQALKNLKCGCYERDIAFGKFNIRKERFELTENQSRLKTGYEIIA